MFDAAYQKSQKRWLASVDGEVLDDTVWASSSEDALLIAEKLYGNKVEIDLDPLWFEAYMKSVSKG